jgi:hypothetical protein
MAATSSVETATAVKAAKTRLSTKRVASRDPAMRKPTEGARMNPGRAARHIGRVSRLMARKRTVRIPTVIEVRLTFTEIVPIGCHRPLPDSLARLEGRRGERLARIN